MKNDQINNFSECPSVKRYFFDELNLQNAGLIVKASVDRLVNVYRLIGPRSAISDYLRKRSFGTKSYEYGPVFEPNVIRSDC